MNKLPQDFKYEKYGYKLRFVNASDAPFIVELRTNPRVSGFLHQTDFNVEKQVEWIESYKVREKRGSDYYFVITKGNQRLGLIRIYKIHDNIFTLGSWTMIPDASLEAILASTILSREVAFEVLNFEKEDAFDGVNVENKKVLRFTLSWGMKPYNRYTNELGEFISLELTRNDYYIAKERKLRQLNAMIK